MTLIFLRHTRRLGQLCTDKPLNSHYSILNEDHWTCTPVKYLTQMGTDALKWGQLHTCMHEGVGVSEQHWIVHVYTYTHACVQIYTFTHMQIYTFTHMQFYACLTSTVLYCVFWLLSWLCQLRTCHKLTYWKYYMCTHLCMHKNQQEKLNKWQSTWQHSAVNKISAEVKLSSSCTYWGQYTWYWTFVFLSCRES